MTDPDNVIPFPTPRPTPLDQWRRTVEEWIPDGDQEHDDEGGRAA